MMPLIPISFDPILEALGFAIALTSIIAICWVFCAAREEK